MPLPRYWPTFVNSSHNLRIAKVPRYLILIAYANVKVSSYQYFCGHADLTSKHRGCFFNPCLRALTMLIADQAPRAICQISRSIPRARILTTVSQNALPRRDYGHTALSQQLKKRLWQKSGDSSAARTCPNAQQRFSTSPVALHGHLDPPKAGEE